MATSITAAPDDAAPVDATGSKLDIEYVDVESLKPYVNNPRRISERAVKKVAEAIENFGFRQPLVVDEDGVVIAGHTRLRAAIKLGLDVVPVHRVTEWPEWKKNLYRVADNRTHEESDWNTELLASELKSLDDDVIGWSAMDTDEIAKLVGIKAEQPADTEEPPPEDEVVSRVGDVWDCGDHVVICGDCTDMAVLERGGIGPESVDCVFTSPPYAVGIDYGVYKDTIENLRAMLPVLATQWMKLCVPGGFAVVNFGDVVAAKAIVGADEPCEYPMALEYWPPFRDASWVLWARRIWAKPHAKVAAPWTAGSCRAASDWEHIWTWKKAGSPIVGRGEFSAFGVWDTSSGHGVDIGKEAHGAGMPVVAADKALRTHSREGHVVLEPFLGTGTTMIAAETSGRRCVGVEINPAYVDMSIRRWESFTGKTASLRDREEGVDGD